MRVSSVDVALAPAGLAAGPILARGAAPDWAASAAPSVALALGPALAARVRRGGSGDRVDDRRRAVLGDHVGARPEFMIAACGRARVAPNLSRLNVAARAGHDGEVSQRRLVVWAAGASVVRPARSRAPGPR
jgi:hypothetical protein